jgi:zinc D-Ala-D-Ala carboxypeptidase
VTLPYISPHFSFEELTITGVASLQAENRVRALAYVPALQALAIGLLEPLRAAFSRPVVIHSGFRCLALNTRIGGSKTSQHMAGEAADLHVDGVSLHEVFDWVRSQPWSWGQVILEGHTPATPSWVHLSTGGRCEALTFDGAHYRRLEA